MDKPKSLLKAVGKHWYFWMGVGLFFISLVPAVTRSPIPRSVYWLLAFTCVFIAFVAAWNDQYEIAKAHRRECDELYADVVLDWLMQYHQKTFPLAALANSMQYDRVKVESGLRILETEFGVVKDNGAAGWFFDAEKAYGLGLYSNLRRLLPSSDA